MTRKKRPEAVADICRRALVRVDEALANHDAGRPEDLDTSILHKVKQEVECMLEVLDRSIYQPSYPRFILDWPDERGLVAFLLEVSYDYQRWT